MIWAGFTMGQAASMLPRLSQMNLKYREYLLQPANLRCKWHWKEAPCRWYFHHPFYRENLHAHYLTSSQTQMSLCGTNQNDWYKTKQGKICGKVSGVTLSECCYSRLQIQEMICSLEMYGLNVVGGSCEGKPIPHWRELVSWVSYVECSDSHFKNPESVGYTSCPSPSGSTIYHNPHMTCHCLLWNSWHFTALDSGLSSCRTLRGISQPL